MEEVTRCHHPQLPGLSGGFHTGLGLSVAPVFRGALNVLSLSRGVYTRTVLFPIYKRGVTRGKDVGIVVMQLPPSW